MADLRKIMDPETGFYVHYEVRRVQIRSGGIGRKIGLFTPQIL